MLTADGGRVIVEDTSTIEMWNARTGQALDKFECTLCTVVRFSNAEKARVVVLQRNREIKDLDTDETLGRLEGDPSSQRIAVLSQEGGRLLAVVADSVDVYDFRSGKLQLRIKHECLAPAPCAILSAGFSADGTRIVTGTNDKAVRVWDAASGKELWRETVSEEVRSAAFSPDGNTVLIAESVWARLLDARSGQRLVEFSRHSNKLMSAVFNRDGSRIVTASLDGTAKVWDVATVAELYRLEANNSAMMDASFSLDGARVLTVSMDRVARLWSVPLSTGDLITRAKARVPRCLTAGQRELFHLPATVPEWCHTLAKWPN
jgi:WD40 repeat protein